MLKKISTLSNVKILNKSELQTIIGAGRICCEYVYLEDGGWICTLVLPGDTCPI
jgi:bacteriocin-like protein